MKLGFIACALVGLVYTQSPELIACIQARCPDQYKKCKATSGCQDKLRKCAEKCGQKVAQTCWTLCLGLPGAAANVATCAVNQGCITNVSTIDKLGMTLMNAIETYTQ